MRSSITFGTSLALFAIPLLSSCFIVDDDLLAQGDGGGGGMQGAETCGDMDAPLLQPGDTVTVDTRGMANDETVSLCTGLWGTSAPGPDSFFRIQVASGEYWHFHIEPVSAGVNPFVYVLPPNCNDGGLCSKNRSSNRCSASAPADEHFGVRFDQSGTWYLGLDDVNVEGGQYRISAFRPACDGMEAQHGESCDGDVAPNDTCTDDCRLYLPSMPNTMASGEGSVPNDDKFWAPELRLSALQTSVTISGTVRGECDPDVFMVPVQATHPRIRVRLVNTEGACIGSPAAPGDIHIRVTDAADSYEVIGANVAGPCFEALTTALPAGEHFVEVSGGDPAANFVYRLQFEVLTAL